MARLEQPAGGAAARVSAHGVVLEYTNVLGASSRRARRQLERAPVKKVHLCRESPCPATLDVALHATLYGPLDPDAVFGFGDGWREHLKTAASCAGNCLRCTGTNTGRAGCCVGRCLGRSVGACCLRRRRREEPQVPKEWRRDDGLSETESEPDDVKCCAHQVFLEEPGMGPVPLARKACHERAMLEDTALAVRDRGADGTAVARLCHYHRLVYQSKRPPNKCAVAGCEQAATVVDERGVSLCAQHGEQTPGADAGREGRLGASPSPPPPRRAQRGRRPRRQRRLPACRRESAREHTSELPGRCAREDPAGVIRLP